jgi:nitrous oxidase accessory protein
MKTLWIILILMLLASMTANLFKINSVASDTRIIQVPGEYLTIQKAINEASPGDTINVSKGIYNEHLNITKNNLRLIGEDRDNTIIDGNQAGTVVKVLAENVTITGFTIRRSGDDGEGLFLNHSNSTIISNNTCSSCHIGISLERSNGNKIMEDIISNSSIGIILAVYSTHNVVSENIVISNNARGMDILAYATNNTVSKNIIVNNWDSGIFLSLTNDNTITDNVITQSKQGINLYRSTKNNITCNTVANNSKGIYIFSFSSNFFYHNNFINNTHQVYIYYSPTNLWDNGSEGNYWSDYNGKDADGNGIGDNPYVIDSNNQDNYPLMSLWRKNESHVEGPVYIKEAMILAIILMAVGIAIYVFKIKKKT